MNSVYNKRILKVLVFVSISITLLVLNGCIQKEEIPKETKTTTTSATQIFETATTSAITSTIATTTTTSTTTTTTLKIPASIENNCIGFLLGAPEEAEFIADLEGGWARPHPGPFVWGWIEFEKGKFDFEQADEWVKKAQENNVAILATIWPYANWDQEKCHGSECYVSMEDQFYPRTKMGFNEGLPKSRCAPCDMNAYKNFLKKLVERYDGDGIDDMPSLKIPIKYWEILNEPEMKETFLTFYKGSQQEYVEILKASREAIKSACEDCKIVQGGAAGINPEMLAYWKKILALGGGNYFDIANIHYISSGDLNTLNVKEFKEVMREKNVNKPIWVTEAQYKSESEVELSVEGALNSGAEKIFFTQFKIDKGGGVGGPPRKGDYSKIYEKIVAKC